MNNYILILLSHYYIIIYKSCIMFVNSLILNVICLGKKDLEEYKKNNVFNLPTKMCIEDYIKSFCDNPFNDEFSQLLMKSDVK